MLLYPPHSLVNDRLESVEEGIDLGGVGSMRRHGRAGEAGVVRRDDGVGVGEGGGEARGEGFEGEEAGVPGLGGGGLGSNGDGVGWL